MKPETPKQRKEKIELIRKKLKPLGFVGTGDKSFRFLHNYTNNTFDFSYYGLNNIENSAIFLLYQAGIKKGMQVKQQEIQKVLGLGDLA